MIFLLLLVCFIDDAQAHFPIVAIDDNSHVKAVQKTSLVALNVDGSDVFHVSRHYGLKQFVWDPGLRGEKNLMYQVAGCECHEDIGQQKVIKAIWSFK